MFGFERKKIITLKIFLKPYMPWLLKNILFKTGLGEKFNWFLSVFSMLIQSIYWMLMNWRTVEIKPKHITSQNV